MTKIAVIYGSSRPSKAGEAVAKMFESKIELPTGVGLDLIDLAEVNLPMIAEPMPPMMGDYSMESTKDWSKVIEGYDGFVFVATTYNHGYAPIIKNAIDTLYNEWTGKAAAIVSYGAAPQSNGAKQLSEVLEHMKMIVANKSLHVSPSHEAISDDGTVDETKVAGDNPQEVLDELVELLN